MKEDVACPYQAAPGSDGSRMGSRALGFLSTFQTGLSEQPVSREIAHMLLLPNCASTAVLTPSTSTGVTFSNNTLCKTNLLYIKISFPPNHANLDIFLLQLTAFPSFAFYYS
ncbi:hypothetical protein TNCV_2746811 [Trichonephila clavipes]|nr:hypothetical protein TNCV_2746811 [Trichonephila clavipes]